MEEKKIQEEKRLEHNKKMKLYMREKRKKDTIKWIETQIKYWNNKLEKTLLEMEVQK